MRSVAFLFLTFGVLAAVLIVSMRSEPTRPRAVRAMRADEAPPVSEEPPVVARMAAASQPGTVPAIDEPDRRGWAGWAERVDEWFVGQRAKQRRSVRVQLALADTFMKAEQFEQAKICFERVLRRDDRHRDALAGLALALWKLGHHAESVDAHVRLLRSWPEAVEARFNYAVALGTLGRDGAAIAEYRRVLAHDPRHARAMYNLAALEQGEGKLSDALRRWRRVTELASNLPSAWFQRGTVAMELHRHEEARDCFIQATRLRPRDARGQSNLGLALLALEQRVEALAAFERAVAADPELVPALCAWAETLAATEANDPDRDVAVRQSRELAERALRLESRNARAQAILARLP